MKTKKTLLINYPNLNVGGIEQFLYELIKYSIHENYRVIWYSFNNVRIADVYKDILDKIEIVYSKRTFFSLFDLQNLHFDDSEDIVFLSFDFFAMADSISLRRKYKKNNIQTLYCVANTRGHFYFPEENCKGIDAKIKTFFAKRCYKKWYSANSLRFFAYEQIKSVEERYGIIINNKENIILPRINNIDPINMYDIAKKSKRSPFNIISVSRFDFPHKNYLLGLIKDFSKLKVKFADIFLYIIGYGAHEKKVIETINSLPNDISKSVFLLGEKSKEEIKQIMKSMHLNISVAGSVASGATNGVLSIPARNFSHDEYCEVYGFLPDSIKKIVSTEPGFPAIPFIEKVIAMSDSEYIDYCLKSYNSYLDRPVDPQYIFDQKTKKIKHGLFWFWLNKVFNHFRQYRR